MSQYHQLKQDVEEQQDEELRREQFGMENDDDNTTSEMIDNDSNTLASDTNLDIDFSTPRVVLCIGKPKKGKSNAIKYWILKNTIDKRIWQFGIVFSKTGLFPWEYTYVPKKFVYPDYEEHILQEYINSLKQCINRYGQAPPNFVIFDDLLGLLNKHDKFLLNFLAIHRHLGCTVFFAFQHLNFGTSTTMREICSHGIFFSSKSTNTLESIYKNFGTLFSNYRQFKRVFHDITKEDYHGMLYIQDEDDVAKNYLDFKAPDMSGVKHKIIYT